MPRSVLALLAIGSFMAGVALNRADWQSRELWRLQGAAVGIAVGYILGQRKQIYKFSDEYILSAIESKDHEDARLEEARLKAIIQNVFTAQWCKENLVLPLSIVDLDCSATRVNVIYIAVSDFAHLAIIGDFIKKRVSEAGLQCQFIEKPAEEIEEKLDHLFEVLDLE